MELSRTLKVFAACLFLSMVIGNSSCFAIEVPTDEVMNQCRTDLTSKKRTVLVERWLTEPFPSEYRRAFGTWLSPDETVEIWTVHHNSNGSSTIVARSLSHEPDERSFAVMVRDTNRVIHMESVSAFEIAFSSKETGGVTGLFFCDMNGPSAEWKWTGKDWAVGRSERSQPLGKD